MHHYLYDTHLHLDLFESFPEIINEIEQNQIYTIAVTNLPALFTKLNKRVSSKYIRPALGFHPELLQNYKQYIPEMWSLLSSTRYIGEVGLDFNMNNEKKIQISFFEELIERCHNFGDKILTIHSRKSSATVVSIIGNNFNGKTVLHWYTGNKTTLKKALEIGCFFSVNYAMLNSKSGVENIKLIPLERLLLETDAPFIKYVNKPFRPKNIIAIVEKLSISLGINIEQLSNILWSNFKVLIK